MRQVPDLVIVRAMPAHLAIAVPNGDEVVALPVDALALRSTGPGPGPDGAAATEPGPDVMYGHFSVFNTWYQVSSWFEGEFMEQIAPGAFADTIAEDDGQIKTTFNHGHDTTMGDLVLGPIDVLAEDKVGPYYEVSLLPSVPALLRDGLRAGLYGSSFRFRVVGETWVDDAKASKYNPQALPERTVTRIALYEFGPVTWPANPAATAALRSMPSSLTDAFYADLQKAHPEQVEPIRAQVRSLRSPAGLPARAAGAGEKSGDGGKPRAVAPATPPPVRSTRKGHKMPAAPPAFPELDQLNTVEGLEARQREIEARQNEIQAAYGVQPLPTEVSQEWDTLVAIRHEIVARCTSYRNREAEIARHAAAGHVEETDPTPAGGTPSGPSYAWQPSGSRDRSGRAPARVDMGIYDLSTIRMTAASPEDAARQFRDRAMRDLDTRTFPQAQAGRLNREDCQGHIERLLERCDSADGELARRILVTGNPVYGRALQKMIVAQPLSTDEQRALSSGTGSAGGFALVYYLDPTFIPTSNLSVNPFRAISRVETIVGTNEWRGVTTAGVTAAYAAEAAESSDNAPTLAQPAIIVNRAQCFVPVSIELTQDLSSLPQSLAVLIQDAKDDLEAVQFTTGTGTPPAPQGVLVGAATTVAAAGTASFAAADPYTLEQALGPRFRPRASIVANRAIWNKVRQFDTAGGAQLWVYLPQGLANDVPRGGNMGVQVMGYPAYEDSGMTTALTTASKIMILGDFRYFVIVDRVGMDVEVIQHLFGASQRPTGQRGFYAYWRNNTKVLDTNAFRVLVTG